MKKVIHTDQAPPAVGPYSQGVQVGDFIFFSGQLGVDPANGEMAEGVLAQAEQVFENIEALLDEAGRSFDDVVKATVFLTDMADFQGVNEIYAKYFKEPYPARSAFAVKGLPLGGLVEIELIVSAK